MIDECRCPKCKKYIDSFDDESNEMFEQKTDCPHCQAPLLVSKRIDVRYDVEFDVETSEAWARVAQITREQFDKLIEGDRIQIGLTSHVVIFTATYHGVFRIRMEHEYGSKQGQRSNLLTFEDMPPNARVLYPRFQIDRIPEDARPAVRDAIKRRYAHLYTD